MKHLPSMSIVTPSFNQGAFLEQTIDSVLSQNYPGLQYLIIDGGSTDNSVAIIKKYEKHLHFWVSEKDKGQSDAINKGLKMSTGEVFNWLNSDDCYTPDALQRVGYLFTDSETEVVCGRSRILQNGSEIRQNKGTDLYPNNLEKTIGCARIDQPETFFRRQCIERMGPLNTRLHYIMDKEWWMRYLLCFGMDQVISIPDILVDFRLHEASKTAKHLAAFDRENFDLFYSIALEHLPDMAPALQAATGAKPIEGLTYNVLPLHTNTDFRAILNYFIWERACMAYAGNRYAEAKKLIALLERPLPDPEDEALIWRISMRITFLPVWLKKIFNTLRS